MSSVAVAEKHASVHRKVLEDVDGGLPDTGLTWHSELNGAGVYGHARNVLTPADKLRRRFPSECGFDLTDLEQRARHGRLLSLRWSPKNENDKHREPHGVFLSRVD